MKTQLIKVKNGSILHLFIIKNATSKAKDTSKTLPYVLIENIILYVPNNNCDKTSVISISWMKSIE